MKVINKDGIEEDFDMSRIDAALEVVPAEYLPTFVRNLELSFHDGMTTASIQRRLIDTAIDLISADEPFWDVIARDLLRYTTYPKRVHAVLKGEPHKDTTFYSRLVAWCNEGLYDADVLKAYTKRDIYMLGERIDHRLDNRTSYIGFKTLIERYCIRSKDGKLLEMPQEAFMGVAMALASVEVHNNLRVQKALDFYAALSNLDAIVATPIMSNARKPRSQLSSCFIATVDDSLEGIMDTAKNFAQVSKNGGGMGIYAGKIRARNSDIAGFKNTSGGVMPFIRIYNDVSVAFNQLGVRKGAVSITLDAWHRDIFDFLQSRTNNGDERMKAHDIFPAVSIPNKFMEVVKAAGLWHLMCPHEVKTVLGVSLENLYGDEFDAAYDAAVANDEIPKKTIDARTLYKAIIKSTTETGTPFLFFRDTANKYNPNKHAGVIYASNLCHEIMQNTSPTDFVVCNLASINLGNFILKSSHCKLELLETVVRMLDNAITLNANRLPVKEAVDTNARYRAIGIGAYGYHNALAMSGIAWESDKHLDFADKLFEELNFCTIAASCKLAQERGAYELFKGSDWENGEYFRLRSYDNVIWSNLAEQVRKHGVRNGYLMAVAPNGSSSHYGNNTQSIDPIFKRVYIDEKKNQVVPVVVPNLSKVSPFLYKSAHHIDQKWSIDANAARQKHIDQSQSFNIYITPQTTATEIAQLYMRAWETGCKTVYYTRSMSLDVSECEACSV